MRKTVFAGVLVLAAAGLFPATSTAFAGEMTGISAPLGTAEIDIARVKRMLKLTDEQKAYWPPVEAALRGSGAPADGAGNGRAGAPHQPPEWFRWCSTASPSRRLVAAARPLVATLRDDQKQTALGLGAGNGPGAGAGGAELRGGRRGL